MQTFRCLYNYGQCLFMVIKDGHLITHRYSKHLGYLVTSLDVPRHLSNKECKHLGTCITMANASFELLKMVISLLIDIPNTWTAIQLRPLWIWRYYEDTTHRHSKHLDCHRVATVVYVNIELVKNAQFIDMNRSNW